MEWLVLFLLVPVIVTFVVLLIGFAGCGFGIDHVPAAPTIVSVIPLDAHTVELKWTDTNGPQATFEIERTKGAEGPAAPITPPPMSPPAGEPHRFVDSLLAGGTQYSYRVRTLTADGDTSGWSDPAAIETWSRAFTSALEQSGTNQSVPGQCIVQRLSPGSLSRPGNLIEVTMRGASDADLAVSRVTISSPALAGDDFDSAASPIDLTSGPVLVTAGLTLPLAAAVFAIDVDEALLIAVDVDIPGNARVLSGVTHTAYVKVPPPGGTVTEAGTQNRAGFAEQSDTLWCIDAVDVATKWPPIS